MWTTCDARQHLFSELGTYANIKYTEHCAVRYTSFQSSSSMRDDKKMENDAEKREPVAGSGAPKTKRPSLGSRPSSEFLGEERSRISVIHSQATPLPGLDDNLRSSHSEENDYGREDILPQSLTEEREKARLSQDHPSATGTVAKRATDVTDEETRKRNSELSMAYQSLYNENQCRRHDSIRSSVTLTDGPRPPPIPRRISSLRQPGAVRMILSEDSISPTQIQSASSFAIKRVPSHTVSDSHTLSRTDDVERNASSSPQSESVSIISSIFAPQLRHLASHPSLHGSTSSSEPRGMGQQGLTPVTEQRHPGKADARISRFTRQFEPGIDDVDGGDYQRQVTYLDMARAEKHGAVMSPSVSDQVEGEQWVEGWRLAVLVVGICLAVLSISADRTLLTTAIPQITSDCQSTADIGWYGSAQLLTICAFQPVFGRVFSLFSVKWAYVLAILMFLAGSLICGLAPDSLALIVGRAVAGFGSAGVLTGSFVVIATAVPVRVRPVCTAIVGLIFGLGATVGPLLGGTFTDLVASPSSSFSFSSTLDRNRNTKKTFLNKILDLDLIGNVLLLGACGMLFLALQYITQGEALSSTKIIGLLSGTGATAIVFVAWRWWKQEGALFPPAIITQRTVAAPCVAAFATYGALLIHLYFLPIWFQAVRGESVVSSGVDMLPYVAAIALFSLLAGIFVSVVGHPPAPAIIGGIIATAGCGKLLTLSSETPTPHWIGFEILVAAGFGMAIQQGFTAVQAVLPPDEVPVGTAAVVASQALGGAFFVSIGNALFQNHLLRASAPGVDIPAVIGAGVTAFRMVVPAETLPIMVSVYNDALRVVLTAAIPLAAVSTIAACFMEWKSVNRMRGA
ncbi:major facilitator superfamily transporter [Colletotrichum cuscutae]|uniref:Major facilitator superfamily transporter n=1 Tax=Colletotrichum cuscutae TaxID=1209917 RepID=A0AAI9U6P9_9PEZI|nr:major facilitator superfamily transporter [Colletotrichum cuscutae]